MDNIKTQARVLIVDDDTLFCKMLEDLLEGMGHISQACHRLDSGRDILEDQAWDLVLLDVGLPDGSGLTLLPWIRQLSKAPEVIIITGEGDADGAELAVNNGAWDYLVKTTALERINLTVARALEHHQTTLRLRALQTLDPCGIIGKSPSLHCCLDMVSQAAMNDFNVLVTGESGTGKELFARAIHANHNRATGQFVVVDCAALPQTLVESVLFGHVKGAFTGADKDTPGLFKQADQGTIFMDEVGELPQDLQRIFLRVLQEKSFRPVGADREVPSNFRLIAATNKDLDQLCELGLFREDLLFRLKSMTIQLPPLRKRTEDVPLLASQYIAGLSQQKKKASKEFMAALENYDWPGNVRELHHVLEAAIAASMNESILIVQHLPPNIRVMLARQGINDLPAQPLPKDTAPLPTIRKYRQLQEHHYLNCLMEESQGDMQRAARISGLSLSRLYTLLKEHNLKS